jgi:hypothetical protein
VKDIFYQDLQAGDFVLRVSTSSQDSRYSTWNASLQGGKPHLGLARITEIKLQAPRRRATVERTFPIRVSEIRFIYNTYHPATGWKVRHGKTLVFQPSDLDFHAIDFLKINPEDNVYRSFVDRLIEYQRLHGVL